MNKKCKRFFSLFTVLIFILSTIMVSVPFKVQAAEGDITKITILGTSDIHGYFVPWDYAMDAENLNGSLSQVYTAVKAVREENKNTILVDAGDSIQGNSVEYFVQNDTYPMVEAMNKMGYDTWTVGNHEFDFGIESLLKITSKFKGQLLAGNVYNTKDGQRLAPAYKIIEKDGVKIALIGITTPMVMEFKKDTDIFKNHEVRDTILETKKIIEELKGKVDAMVGVMHMGEENENGVANTGLKDIANACPELTAIVGGHMHLLVKGNTVNGVLIVEPNKYGTNISRIDLSFKKVNDKFELVDKKGSALTTKDFKSDKELEDLLAPYHNKLREYANETIGELKGLDMVPKNEIKGIPQVQIQSTPLTRFLNEVQLYYSKADVTALQIDNDNAKLDVGQIKRKDIAYNYQYATGETTVYEMTGKDLKDYMEWAVDYFNTLKDGDVTISFNPVRRASKYSTNDIFGGVTYKVDLTKDKGERITDLKLNSSGKLIKAEDTLKVGLNSYRLNQLIAKGGPLEGRKYKQLWSSTDANAYGEDGGTIRNLAIKYIKEVKNGVVETKNDRNWEIVGIDKDSDAYKAVAYLINNDMIDLVKTADGKYTNVASINIKDKVSKEEIDAITTKADISKEDFNEDMTKGEFYVAVYRALNPVKEEPKDEDNKEDDNTVPVEVKDPTAENKNNDFKNLPKTGSPVDGFVVVTLGAVLVFTGLYNLSKGKSKNNIA